MLGQFSLPQINRFASLGILPLMLLAIAVFSRSAQGSSPAEPPTAGTLVVANLREETLTFVRLAEDRTDELLLPGPPHEMVFETGRLYVTLGRADLLVEVDPRAPGILRTIRLEGEPHGIAVLGGNLYVTLDKSNEVVVIDRATLTELRRLPTGETPHVIAASGAGIVVTDSRDNVLRQIEPDGVTVSTGGQPEGIAIVGKYVVTADALSGSVTIADFPGMANAKTIAVGAASVRVTALNASQVLVSLQGAGEVAVLRVDDSRVTKRLIVSDRPDGLCLTAQSTYLAVASNADGTVELFEVDGWKRAPAFTLKAGLGSCTWIP